MGPTWGPPGSCGPQMGPMLAPWILLSGLLSCKSVLRSVVPGRMKSIPYRRVPRGTVCCAYGQSNTTNVIKITKFPFECLCHDTKLQLSPEHFPKSYEGRAPVDFICIEWIHLQQPTGSISSTLSTLIITFLLPNVLSVTILLRR